MKGVKIIKIPGKDKKRIASLANQQTKLVMKLKKLEAERNATLERLNSLSVASRKIITKYTALQD